MASAEQLKISHCIDGRVKSVEEKVQDVGHRVQSVGSNICGGVQGVNERLDQVNRSLSL